LSALFPLEQKLARLAKNENLQCDGPLGPTGYSSHPSIKSSAQVHAKSDFFKS
jgi:hypothetical protein